jgi:hypothetical protein
MRRSEPRPALLRRMIIDDIMAAIRAAMKSKRSVSFDWRGYLEESVGLSPKLLESLNKDDDWTFIIKTHGIIEAGLNHMILERLGCPGLTKFISKMDTSAGKLAIVKALDLLPENARMFVRVLSTVRNAAVHDVRNFDISLIEYEKKLNPDQRKNWKKGLGVGVAPGTSVVDNPRAAILSGCMIVLGHAMKQQLIAMTERELHTTMYEGIRELAEASDRKRRKKLATSKTKKR